MTFTSQPELMTGITDLLDALAALAFLFLILRCGTKKSQPWKLLMISLAISGILGFFVHTFEHGDRFDSAVWRVLSLFMCATVSLFAACAAVELWERFSKRIYIVCSAAAVVAYAAMMTASFFTERYLLIYTVFAALCLVFSLYIFAYEMIRKRAYHFLFYITGILIQIPGGIIQAQRKMIFKVIFTFDFNGFYHLILLVSIILLYAGFAIDRKYNINTETNQNFT